MENSSASLKCQESLPPYVFTQGSAIFFMSLASINVIIGLVGAVFNILFIITVKFSKQLRSLFYMILLTLAVYDFVCSLFVQLPTGINLALLGAQHNVCPLSTATSIIGYSVSGSSTFTVVFLALEKIYAISTPFTYHRITMIYSQRIYITMFFIHLTWTTFTVFANVRKIYTIYNLVLSTLTICAIIVVTCSAIYLQITLRHMTTCRNRIAPSISLHPGKSTNSIAWKQEHSSSPGGTETKCQVDNSFRLSGNGTMRKMWFAGIHPPKRAPRAKNREDTKNWDTRTCFAKRERLSAVASFPVGKSDFLSRNHERARGSIEQKPLPPAKPQESVRPRMSYERNLRTTFFILLSFICSYIPVIAYGIYDFVNGGVSQTAYQYALPLVQSCVLLTSFFNPICYLLRLKTIQIEMKKMLRGYCRAC